MGISVRSLTGDRGTDTGQQAAPQRINRSADGMSGVPLSGDHKAAAGVQRGVCGSAVNPVAEGPAATVRRHSCLCGQIVGSMHMLPEPNFLLICVPVVRLVPEHSLQAAWLSSPVPMLSSVPSTALPGFPGCEMQAIGQLLTLAVGRSAVPKTALCILLAYGRLLSAALASSTAFSARGDEVKKRVHFAAIPLRPGGLAQRLRLQLNTSDAALLQHWLPLAAVLLFKGQRPAVVSVPLSLYGGIAAALAAVLLCKGQRPAVVSGCPWEGMLDSVRKAAGKLKAPAKDQVPAIASASAAATIAPSILRRLYQKAKKATYSPAHPVPEGRCAHSSTSACCPRPRTHDGRFACFSDWRFLYAMCAAALRGRGADSHPCLSLPMPDVFPQFTPTHTCQQKHKSVFQPSPFNPGLLSTAACGVVLRKRHAVNACRVVIPAASRCRAESPMQAEVSFIPPKDTLFKVPCRDPFTTPPPQPATARRPFITSPILFSSFLWPFAPRALRAAPFGTYTRAAYGHLPVPAPRHWPVPPVPGLLDFGQSLCLRIRLFSSGRLFKEAVGSLEGRRLRPPVGAMTDLTTFVTLAEGQLRFLALSWPEEGRTAPVPEAVCVPVMKRQEGLLLCIPCGFLSLATLDEGENADAHSLVGPSHQCTVPFAVSDEQGVEQPLEMEGSVLLVDFGAQVLPQLRDLGEDIISDTLFPFDLHQLEAVPMSEELLAIARRWAAVTHADRAAFYSAVEDQVAADVGPGGKAKAKRAAPKKKVTAADLAQQMSFLTAMLPQLAEQLTAVKEKQEDLEKKVQPGLPEPVPSPAKPAHQLPFMPPRGPGLPVAKQASLVGPPPRTRNQDASPALAAPLPLAVEPGAAGVGAIPQDSFQAAMLQQSQALTALVGHLMSQQDGGLGDLSASSSTSYVGSKGAARRERLQAALANRSGDFYLAVLQAAAKRLTPSSPAPASLGDCLGQVSMCQYFERFGGFAGQRETGYIMWCLAHVMDCVTSEDYAGAREFLAVTVVALDQSALDGGRWDFAWLLTLLEEPPAQLFHGRGAVANPRTRAFSPLSPVGWTTCALQYLKEVDLITTRRLESLGSHRQPAAPPAADTEGQDGNKPKRLSRPAPPSGVIFPVPLPFAGVFARFPLDCSSRVRRRIMHQRLVHIVCMALNFLHANFVPIPLPLIQRPMNVAQRSLVAHVGRHLKAFGASVGEFVLAGSGRRNPQLIARLSELMSFLAASAATGDSYADRSGTVVPTHNEAHPGLDPFRSLDVSRLKLSGQGLWDPTPYLSEELFMAFTEPRSLLHGRPPPDTFVPVWTRECPLEVASLAALWDRLGLLRLAPASLLKSEAYLLARAFNCYKAPDKDRMIIDRRGQNWAESRLPGPSLFIPVGPMLGMLEVDPARQTVYCAASDRKDFYHQIAAPPAKALSNVLGPALPRKVVCNLSAFGRLLPSPVGLGCAGGPRHRLVPPKRGSLLFEPNHYLVCFGAIAQGDHLGVEVGSASHEGLLLSGGLLSEDVRLCSNRPFKGIAGAQGLVIDDFFSISVSDLTDVGPPPCVDDLHRAKAIYAAAELAGSDDKDVWGEQSARIAGAEINSSPHARARNIVTVAAPAAKRVALALLSLEAARLSHVTDTLWLSLVGSWTSAALFRRPLMSIFSEVYRVAPASNVKASKPTLYSLPRPAAQEVVLASVLSPLAACDLAAPFRAELFATDASEVKGGYTVAKAGVDLIRPLWRTASKKGGYSRLLSKEEAVLTRFEDREPFDLRIVALSSQTDPGRPLAYYFDVLEVGSSNGQVSDFLSSWGRSVGPVFAVEVSPVYDLAQVLDVLRAFRCLALLLSARSCSVPALLLQAASILRLIRALAPSGPCRVVILVDSAVAATCLLAGVFPAFHFAFSAWLAEQVADLEGLLDLSPLSTRSLSLPSRFLCCGAGLERDLLLPGDVCDTIAFALISISVLSLAQQLQVWKMWLEANVPSFHFGRPAYAGAAKKEQKQLQLGPFGRRVAARKAKASKSTEDSEDPKEAACETSVPVVDLRVPVKREGALMPFPTHPRTEENLVISIEDSQ
ncbi:hypothetical protein AK812_SmicGene35057 [Symbiodinium microadriaticum]|uniref:Uncharacterized protein n=1 Tax=Symbiodinium microadriaticum TaxID=2951 RepID=A0A1Q9CMF1_SYMMI|nr:hypothetical protein AK812_SmicGene35057 [Symbiodinium microadriaticum]